MIVMLYSLLLTKLGILTKLDIWLLGGISWKIILSSQAVSDKLMVAFPGTCLLNT